LWGIPRREPARIDNASGVSLNIDNAEVGRRIPMLDPKPLEYGTKDWHSLLGLIDSRFRDPVDIVTALG
jgi:hypothetical protein